MSKKYVESEIGLEKRDPRTGKRVRYFVKLLEFPSWWGLPIIGSKDMLRNFVFAMASSATLILSCVAFAATAQYGTAEEAKALLERAVAAVKDDKAKALEMFNKGEDGFKDRDLYVFCANASDGAVTAHPTSMGEQLQDIKDKKGFPHGQEMMQKATEGTIKEITYWLPRAGTDTPLEKISFYTKAGDQICGVGYYK
jgi:hypothetical protein